MIGVRQVVNLDQYCCCEAADSAQYRYGLRGAGWLSYEEVEVMWLKVVRKVNKQALAHGVAVASTLLVGVSHAGEKRFTLNAGAGTFGRSITVSCLYGMDPATKFSIIESTVKERVIFETRSKGGWRSFQPGEWTNGQEIEIRAMSAGAAGEVHILVSNPCFT